MSYGPPPGYGQQYPPPQPPQGYGPPPPRRGLSGLAITGIVVACVMTFGSCMVCVAGMSARGKPVATDTRCIDHPYDPGCGSAGAAVATTVGDASTHDAQSQAQREARAAATWPDDQKAIASNLDDGKKDRARQDWTDAEAALDLAWDGLKRYQGTSIEETAEWSSLKARMDAEEDLVWPHYQKAKSQQDEANAIELRKNYASEFDDALLAKHMNPDRVVATGPKATTLHVDGWFCSRQWIFDESQDASALAAMGFTRLECSNSIGFWWQDLR